MARRSSILHFFISRNIIERFSVGCDKVNCGNAAREGALGYDLGAPNVAHMHAHNRRGEHCSP